MKRLFKKSSLVVVFLLVIFVLLATANANAEYPPFLTFGGDFIYDADSKLLTFEYNYAEWIDYINGENGYDDPMDPVLGATISFGTLMNSSTNYLIFGPDPGGSTGPVDFSIDGFITAKIDNFIVADSALMWGNIYDIQTVEGAPSSRYVDELVATGGGNGLISIDFRTYEGYPVDFTVSSSGYIGGTVAVAPEPISALLFVTGGVTLALRRFRDKKI